MSTRRSERNKSAVKAAAEIEPPPTKKQKTDKKAKDDEEDKKGAKKQEKKQEKKQVKTAAQPKAKQDAKEVKAQLKTLVLKGKAPVDQHLPGKQNYHVLEQDGIIYDTTLNQSNLSANNNKFYRLQVVQADDKSHFITWFRWGRVGFVGQNYYRRWQKTQVANAIYQYNRKKNDKLKEYKQVQINYEEQKKLRPAGLVASLDPDKAYNDCKLATPIKSLLRLIFDMKMINNQMMEIGYDPSKLPLGKLAKSSIMKGYETLKAIADEIDGPKRNDAFERLSSDFYTYIPHNIGFNKMINYVIKTHKVVKQKLQMLKSLQDIQVATKMLDEGGSGIGNQLQENYAKLKTQISVLAHDSKQFLLIAKYVQNTHAKTHSNYSLRIDDVFKLQREGEEDRYTKDIGNKVLLWHGSRLTNFVGILSQGLRIAPPEAPVTGYMFGKGVYFADMASKSANYCFTSRQNNTGLLLLCEVALGKCNLKYQADYYAGNLPEGCKSTKGVGSTHPDPAQSEMLGDVEVPCGKGVPQPLPQKSSLLYNQFIVYSTQQVRLKYLLRLTFQYK